VWSCRAGQTTLVARQVPDPDKSGQAPGPEVILNIGV